MPALVAKADTSTYHCSLAPNPCKRYNTRNNPNTVQPKPAHWESEHSKPNSKKLAGANLLLANKNSKGSSVKTPPVVEQEVQESKAIQLVPATTMASTDLLSDVAPNESLHLDRLSSNSRCRKSLKILDQANSREQLQGWYSESTNTTGTHTLTKHHSSFLVWECGNSNQYSKLWENWTELTYDYIAQILTIEMPSTLHEEPFNYLKECMTLAIASLPYNRDVIRPQIHMNYQLQIAGQLVTPDMTVALTSVDGPTEVVMISGLGECALSEDKEHAFDKMEAEIESHPETIFAVIMVIHEAITYACPQLNSTASTTLHNGDKEPDPLPLKSFIEYFIWIKGKDSRPINIRSNDPSHMAYGVLVPESSMDAVTDMLENRLRKMRDRMVDFSKEISPGLDCSDLVEADVALPILWRLAMKGILSAVDVTAHQHYQTWHVATFRGTKHNHDDSYYPSELESGKGSSQSEEPEASPLEPSEGKVIVPLPQPGQDKDVDASLKNTKGEGVDSLPKPTQDKSRSKGLSKRLKA
ncbi:uncharacterized protein BJ212DRAFT_1299673 [Suillus subaureus]|uniref:Uncharacterized protein n=1 Tax=Suillus subaureus TaxID=48587 RepID=A0A9P7JDR2_9AGAM|nr:uncharacterized protein BJ212DRAFT_1299673 [Suillus subaureus]KAG1816388.1 hypothetical protein BJ212DRAFT_1299673 [Suillus subaureus]